MLQSLQGKTAIVTGGSRGIGKGIAQRFGEAGLNVLVVSRQLADAEAVAAAIGPNASGFAADVSEPEACDAMAATAIERYGAINVLCANAGIFPAAKLGAMTAADFDHVISTNLRSTFLSVTAVLPAMTSAGSGRIILTSSITGPITGYPGWSHYGASKAGQLGFMRTAAIELALKSITVNAVLPGNIFTEGLDGIGGDYIAKMEGSIPMKRLGSVTDIANAALFFASEEAGYITGQALTVDGGQILPESLGALEEMDA
jgi:3-oxoacyl-[acyl-carrier protein] reductase